MTSEVEITAKLNHITIDLGQKNVETALGILRQRKRRKKVASALVHTRSSRYGRIAYHGKKTNQELFVRVFEALTDFPKLKKLTIEFAELETFITLPVTCLLLILTQKQTRLKCLGFSNIRFEGDEADLAALAETIRRHPSLMRVVFHNCAGDKASLDPVVKALAEVPTMRNIELKNTRLRANDLYAADSITWDGSSLVKLCQYPCQVKNLVIKDVPDVGNRHVIHMANAMSTNKSKLKELTISSVRLEDRAGRALMSMLEANRSLVKMSLDFEFGLVSCASAIADALATNQKLEDLTLNLSGSVTPETTASQSSSFSSNASSYDTDDDEDEEAKWQHEIDAVDSSIELIAKALRDNTTLRHLQLSLDLDDYTTFQNSMENSTADNASTTSRNSGTDESNTQEQRYFLPVENDDDPFFHQPALPTNEEDRYSKITYAFEDLLQNYNFTLHTLHVNDGMFEWKTFHAKIEFLLKLNRAGIRVLLQQENATKEQWVQAIMTQKDDINVLYYLLSRNPSLCCGTFGHVRDAIIREVSCSTVGETKEEKKQTKTLSWWKRGTNKRKKMLRRLAPVFALHN